MKKFSKICISIILAGIIIQCNKKIPERKLEKRIWGWNESLPCKTTLQGSVIDKDVNGLYVRLKPIDGKIITQIHERDSVFISEIKNGWLKIHIAYKYKKGCAQCDEITLARDGWVSSTLIGYNINLKDDTTGITHKSKIYTKPNIKSEIIDTISVDYWIVKLLGCKPNRWIKFQGKTSSGKLIKGWFQKPILGL